MTDAFSKVIGYASIKAELNNVVDIINNPEKYKQLGVTIPHGAILMGPPGVGKSLMANCFIDACARKCFICRKRKADGDFVNEIRRTFDAARSEPASIVLLDDMDKFSNCDDRHRNSEEFVTIQSCIDECAKSNVFVIATANDIDDLPYSLLRPGRFDIKINVNPPKGKDAEEIIKFYLSQKKLASNIDSKQIAHMLEGRSCAQLETVINEAGVYAGYQNKNAIEMCDIVKACLRVIFGAPQDADEMDDEICKRIAYHEAGHAIVNELLEPNSINLISVYTSDSDSVGVTNQIQDENYFFNKKYMENRVICLLAGKAATEIIFGETDVGANSDTHRAFNIVERFVDNYTSYGFDAWINRNQSSDALLARRETQTQMEVARYYNIARKMLVDNKEFLDKLAEKLAEKKTLLASDVQEVKSTCKLVA